VSAVKTIKEVARPRCPECGGEGVKCGFKITRKGRKQRWLCKNCGRTFYATETS
jgi:transposase-like protein